MPESASVTNSSTFGVRRCGSIKDQRWSSGCTDPQMFDCIIVNNIEKENRSQLVMALPKTDPLQNFHIDGLIKLAAAKPESRLLVKSWLTNYKSSDPVYAASAKEKIEQMITDLSSEGCS